MVFLQTWLLMVVVTDGVSADMVTNGGDLLHNGLPQLFNRMLATHFPECLSVSMITAIFNLQETLTCATTGA